MRKEIPIPGMEGLYTINIYGGVYSIPRPNTSGGYLKPQNSRGYKAVRLYCNGSHKLYKVHRLVALAFVGGYFEGAQVNHIDEDKTNNYYRNLEWVTSFYNTEYSCAKSYTITYPNGVVLDVFNLSEFCRNNNLDRSNMIRVSKGRQSHHKGFKCRAPISAIKGIIGQIG
tara:strand:- start:1376 stop:1885 length:510 start_codon:yes stop_codon:yes gene_type:complete